mmetsp:Transcript_26327/g.78778  ORF Transcript_26327/g.78778 Transcript_26327/m.78778 type:complete len:207 (-) Transcript_26327:30-650(-)
MACSCTRVRSTPTLRSRACPSSSTARSASRRSGCPSPRRATSRRRWWLITRPLTCRTRASSSTSTCPTSPRRSRTGRSRGRSLRGSTRPPRATRTTRCPTRRTARCTSATARWPRRRTTSASSAGSPRTSTSTWTRPSSTRSRSTTTTRSKASSPQSGAQRSLALEMVPSDARGRLIVSEWCGSSRQKRGTKYATTLLRAVHIPCY